MTTNVYQFKPRTRQKTKRVENQAVSLRIAIVTLGAFSLFSYLFYCFMHRSMGPADEFLS